MTKHPPCLVCGKRPAKKLKAFSEYGVFFCSLHCAANYGFNHTMDMHFCKHEQMWLDGQTEDCEECNKE